MDSCGALYTITSEEVFKTFSADNNLLGSKLDWSILLHSGIDLQSEWSVVFPVPPQ
jgi:hypothetical protein